MEPKLNFRSDDLVCLNKAGRKAARELRCKHPITHEVFIVDEITQDDFIVTLIPTRFTYPLEFALGMSAVKDCLQHYRNEAQDAVNAGS